jgi:hypothetical protein
VARCTDRKQWRWPCYRGGDDGAIVVASNGPLVGTSTAATAPPESTTASTTCCHSGAISAETIARYVMCRSCVIQSGATPGGYIAEQLARTCAAQLRVKRGHIAVGCARCYSLSFAFYGLVFDGSAARSLARCSATWWVHC